MELDWNLCVICQRKTPEALKCPLENPVKKGNKKDAYTNFPNHVKQFQDIDSLAAAKLKEQNLSLIHI